LFVDKSISCYSDY